jgi:hypothetical protein
LRRGYIAWSLCGGLTHPPMAFLSLASSFGNLF